MQYMGGKSRIARSIANIINEVPRWKIKNSSTTGAYHQLCCGGGIVLSAFSAGVAPLKVK